MKCIGTSQHIKDKYGSGYQLEIKLKTAKIATEDLETSAIKDFVAFTNSIFSDDSEAPELKENFGGRLTFKVPRKCVKSLGSIFASLEARKRVDVEEFSFSQSTLEQVFLDFAKMQVEEE